MVTIAQQASDILWQAWQKTDLIDAIPAPLRPKTRAEGYAIQAEVMRYTRKPLFGWKIAATSVAGQKHINVDGPLAGRILTEKVVTEGATVPLGRTQMRVAEAEFAFRMGRDLMPRGTPYAIADCMAAVASLHVGIEVPDSRFTDFTKVGANQLIADCSCAHVYMLGPAVAADWRGADLAAHAVTGTLAGRGERRIVHQGKGANVLGGPAIALAWLVNELSGLGMTLKAGEIVTTGTCIVPLPIQPGDSVTMDFGVFGRVGLAFA
jgi:2-keto-4-pentenoate hydratase